ncbi:hypothetical protein CAPTEDRAFT_195033 [Capitella teleta]|uniref:Uncharacterized protein n=1 Tax=Capitella teleta TaxID=283909 RepID=R7UI61_CAPTE|nr:hypothetical protein CAPTEDRAFT_195033 [Capitella teleta]|eukprot:ELU05905.1 hypothetical protein CAPTEDRAFT_195033 [Capitella teleta]
MYDSKKHFQRVVKRDDFGGSGRRTCLSQNMIGQHQLQIDITRIDTEAGIAMKRMERLRRHFTKKYSHYLARPKPEDDGLETPVSLHLSLTARPSKKTLKRLTQSVLTAQEIINCRVKTFTASVPQNPVAQPHSLGAPLKANSKLPPLGYQKEAAFQNPLEFGVRKGTSRKKLATLPPLPIIVICSPPAFSQVKNNKLLE